MSLYEKFNEADRIKSRSDYRIWYLVAAVIFVLLVVLLIWIAVLYNDVKWCSEVNCNDFYYLENNLICGVQEVDCDVSLISQGNPAIINTVKTIGIVYYYTVTTISLIINFEFNGVNRTALTNEQVCQIYRGEW